MYKLQYLKTPYRIFTVPTTLSFTCVLIMLFILLSCGIQFKQASLYDGREVSPPPAKPAKIALAVEPVIFDDDGTNFWVADDPACTTGNVTSEVAYSGSSALKINWNRNPSVCEWAGFGIGWDDYAGKDLTEVYDFTAIEMYVRSQQGKMFGLPIVLTLEDYSGKMAWSYTSSKYFERYFIDEQWQKVSVPLNTFDLSEDGLDISNIKQLLFELQQTGGIYVDAIRLVFYEPEPATPWIQETPREDPLAFPIQLFGDIFINDNGWGIHSDHCQSIEFTTTTASEGALSIHAMWDMRKKDCYVVALGVSWNRWYPVNLSKVAATIAIEFDMKVASTPAMPLVLVGFEDYERNASLALLTAAFITGSSPRGQWQRVRIPILELQGSANLADIKQLVIRMEQSGEIYLDNIRLVDYM